MKGKYLKRIGAFILATLMLAGIAFVSPSTAEAQGRRRVIIVRPVHRPFWWGRRYDPWPYRYSEYVFRDSEKAVSQGYKDGFKTGKDDGKKAKSYSPERSHYYHDAGFGNFAEVYRGGFSRGYQEGYRVGQNNRAS